MPTTWFIGDLHFAHPNIARIRGFRSSVQHDAELMSMWDHSVKPNDLVYVMGDISSGSRGSEVTALKYLALLPGSKRLISGNHDSVSGIHRRLSVNQGQYNDVFESIRDYGHITINHMPIQLSHYPYASSGDGPNRDGDGRFMQYRLPDLGALLIHAHTHHNDPFSGSSTGREMCVSWEAWGHMVNLSEVTKWYESLMGDLINA